MCAFVPVAPLAPTTSVSTSNVVITWAAPSSNGGSPLTSYSIYIRKSDLSYSMETNYCDGSNTVILGAATCTIPFATLRASPFNLILNNPVIAYVVATNVYGNSDPSPTGQGALIQYVPDAPISLANNPSITSATRVGLTWAPGSSNGGSAVIDYTINYSLTNDNFALLVSGLTTPSYTTTTTLVKGNTYFFQIIARNSVGFSLPSASLSVLVA